MQPVGGDEFSHVYQAAAVVLSERKANLALRAEIRDLREHVLRAEAEARLLGDVAVTMPEDLGIWSLCGPRIEGLAVRILQVQDQSMAFASVFSRDKSGVVMHANTDKGL